MKKIGILTFHRAMNSGAMLQAYALQTVLSKKYYVEVIDYRCDEIEHTYGYRTDIRKFFKRIAKYILRPKTSLLERKRFKKFVNFSNRYLKKSIPYNKKSIYKANDHFNMFIAGSDQIWNPKWSGNDWNYFLEFADDRKKFSYAASFGGDKIEEINRIRIHRNLSTFQNLFLREQSGIRIVNELGISSPSQSVTCDPVFLLTKEEWINNFQITTAKEEYILVYFTAPQTNSVEIAKKISLETGKKVVYLNSFKTKNLDNLFENLIDAGPCEFLFYIKNASLVITTSFHAMAFSLIFNTPFLYELKKSKMNNNSRLENLASIFNVEDREIKDKNNIEYNALNWDTINKKLLEYELSSKSKLSALFQE